MNPPLVAGSASRDLSADDPRGWRLGGAAAYCGLTLARLGLRPRVILGVDGPAATAEELDLLREAGADVLLVPLTAGPVFRNRVTPAGRAQDCLEPGAPLDAAVPADWSDSSTWLLVPVADELGPRWAALPAAAAFVAVGWQGLLRNLPRGGVVRRRAPRRDALIERAGLVSVSREDLDEATTMADLVTFLHPPASLVCTDGEQGGVVWSLAEDGSTAAEPYESFGAEVVVDTTGAGDAFLAALIAARLGHALVASAAAGADTRFAAAVASLVVEGPGLYGVPELAAVAARLAMASDAPGTAAADAGSRPA